MRSRKNKSNVYLIMMFFLVFIVFAMGGFLIGNLSVKAPEVTPTPVMNISIAENNQSSTEDIAQAEKVGYIIREYEDYIALFEVFSDNSTELFYVTDTHVDRLRNEDIELIREGIFTKDYEEAQETLENFLN